MYLTRVKPFTFPSKMYGNIDSTFAKIDKTFSSRDNSTGVLLSGVKGSGKTLLTKYIATKYIKKGVPVILINQYISPSLLTDLASNMKEAVFIFDEFDKVWYDNTEDGVGNDVQNGLLTLLDGLYTSKKLFIFTCNDEHRVNPHMINRPSRIYYTFKYKVLPQSIIEEICDDRLKKGKYKKEIVNISNLYGNFTYDILTSLIDILGPSGVISPVKRISLPSFSLYPFIIPGVRLYLFCCLGCSFLVSVEMPCFVSFVPCWDCKLVSVVCPCAVSCVCSVS